MPEAQAIDQLTCPYCATRITVRGINFGEHFDCPTCARQLVYQRAPFARFALFAQGAANFAIGVYALLVVGLLCLLLFAIGSCSLMVAMADNTPELTPANYRQLQRGITLEQARDILGATGETIHHDAALQTIHWNDRTGASRKYIRATFKDGRLINAVQAGIERDP